MKNTQLNILFHVPEAARSLPCLNNVRNYLAATGNKAQIQVVFNGDAIKTLLTGEATAQRWQALLADSPCVQLLVCNNSLTGFALRAEQLISPTEVVPAAVLTLIERQQQGWIYLRP